MDALFFRGRRTRRIMRSTEVVRGGVDAEGTSPSAVPDSPSHIVFRRHDPRVRDNPRSDSLTRPPPDTHSGDSSPPSRRGHGLASGAAPETSRRLAPVPGDVPGDGDVASGDPPKVSQSPREKGTSRVARDRRRRDGSHEETSVLFRYETNTTEKIQQDEQKSARSRERSAREVRERSTRDDGATAAVGGG